MKGWLRRGCILRSLRLAVPWISVRSSSPGDSSRNRNGPCERSVPWPRHGAATAANGTTKHNEAMQCVQLSRSSQLGLSSSEKLRPESAEIPGLIWIKWITYESSHAHSLCLLNVRCILHVFWRHTDLIVDTRAECAFASVFFFPHHTVQYPSISVQNNIYSLLNFVELRMSKERDLKCSGKPLTPDAKAVGDMPGIETMSAWSKKWRNPRAAERKRIVCVCEISNGKRIVGWSPVLRDRKLLCFAWFSWLCKWMLRHSMAQHGTAWHGMAQNTSRQLPHLAAVLTRRQRELFSHVFQRSFPSYWTFKASKSSKLQIVSKVFPWVNVFCKAYRAEREATGLGSRD